MKSFLPLAVAACLALGGCAGWKVDKTAIPSPQDVQVLSAEIAKVREFQSAVYDVSVFSVDRCERKSTREPFALLTLGSLEPFLSKEKIAAYYHAGGFDEQWHVLWAHQESGLQKGDNITHINGNKLDNNKTGLGEAPLQLYFNAITSAREAALTGKPFVVRRADGRELQVKVVPACRTIVWSMPLLEQSNYAGVTLNGPVVIPANAIQAAQTTDELRYLAAIAVYLSASAEANGRRQLAVLGLGLAAATVFVNPLLYAATTFPTARGITGAETSGMVENAALFATEVVSDMGGSPRAGLDLVERLEAKKLGADRVLLDANSKAKVEAVVSALEAGLPKPGNSADRPGKIELEAR